ncbi:MAG: DegV family protein [Dehalococcoidia bacterium]|nr:DegV family protein [Dehalococcoidia bacterium]
MPVRIVTDSASDISIDLAKELNITIIPQYLIFDTQCYRDRIDISEGEFYHRLVYEKTQPTTSQPTLQDFLTVYDELSAEADGIVSIHISNEMSGTILTAQQAQKLSKAHCPIAVIDSRGVSMLLGITAIAAAKAANAGKSFQEVVDEVQNTLDHLHALALFDTLTYLARGGRIGKAKSLIGSILNVKPLLTVRNGEFSPVSQVRSATKAKEKLLEFANGFDKVKDMAVVYSTDREEASLLAGKIKSFPTEDILLAQLSPVIGAHTGPGLLAIIMRTYD